MKSSKKWMLLPSMALLVTLAAADSKYQTSLVSGMTVTTANSVATVEVRAKSFGPGFCGVNFSTDHGDKVTISAPPLAYSDWRSLASHIGSVTYRVEYEATCDTGALAEIRYFKD